MIGSIVKQGGGKNEIWKVTFNVIPTNTNIELKDLKNIIINPTSKENGKIIYDLPTGIYKYTANAEEYIEQEVSRLEIYQETTIDIKLKKELSAITFSDATDEELERMLTAHYNKEIDLETIWNIGDERVIDISAISSDSNNSTPHSAQKMVITIIGFNHDDLSEQMVRRTKAALTLQCREVLGNNGVSENDYYWGSYLSPVNDTDVWSKSPMRKWLNSSFLNALPQIYQKNIKTVIKKSLDHHYYSYTTTEDTYDKVFWLSYPEVFGTKTYTYYLSNHDPNNYEGTQYPYFTDSTKNIKYINNNGTKSNSSSLWWLRSSSSNRNYDNSYCWCVVSSDSNPNNYAGFITWGSAPAFCM